MSTSSTSTAARRPVSSSSTGAKPTARDQRPIGLPLPHSSTMTDERCPSSRIRTIAASAPSADQAATGSPGPGQAERAGDAHGIAGVVVDGEQVGGPHPLGDVGAGSELDDAGRDAARGCRPRSAARRAATGPSGTTGRAGSTSTGRRQRLDAADVVGPRAGEVRAGAPRPAAGRPRRGSARRRSAATRAARVGRAARAGRRRRRAPGRGRCRPRWPAPAGRGSGPSRAFCEAVARAVGQRERRRGAAISSAIRSAGT